MKKQTKNKTIVKNICFKPETFEVLYNIMVHENRGLSNTVEFLIKYYQKNCIKQLDLFNNIEKTDI